MTDTAFDDYLRQWRDANPQCAVAWLFLRPAEQSCFGALAAMEREWLKAVREIREPQVALVKLGWWREEMERAPTGATRHPLTQALFADPRAQRAAPALWLAPVDAAVVQLNQPPAADFAAQCAATLPLAQALAALETAVWFGPTVAAARATEVTLIGLLASALRGLDNEIEHGRSPLPMSLLARHGLTIDALGSATAERQAACRDYADQLAQRLAATGKLAGPLTLLRAAGCQRDRDGLRRAARAAEPLATLRTPAHKLGNVLKIWRTARTWRGMAENGSDA